jgi:uncharacterized protein YneF (UPF0154 family)
LTSWELIILYSLVCFGLGFNVGYFLASRKYLKVIAKILAERRMKADGMGFG